MISHSEITDEDLRRMIKGKRILLGGNKQLKIYGKLGCKSGKRMKRQRRVFFTSSKEAEECGFRPCGHCMKAEYRNYLLQ